MAANVVLPPVKATQHSPNRLARFEKPLEGRGKRQRMGGEKERRRPLNVSWTLFELCVSAYSFAGKFHGCSTALIPRGL